MKILITIVCSSEVRASGLAKFLRELRWDANRYGKKIALTVTDQYSVQEGNQTAADVIAKLARDINLYPN